MERVGFTSIEPLSDEQVDFPNVQNLIMTRNIPQICEVHVTCKNFIRLSTIIRVNTMNRTVSEDFEHGRSCP